MLGSPACKRDGPAALVVRWLRRQQSRVGGTPLAALLFVLVSRPAATLKIHTRCLCAPQVERALDLCIKVFVNRWDPPRQTLARIALGLMRVSPPIDEPYPI